jgi:hypothetical protein
MAAVPQLCIDERRRATWFNTQRKGCKDNLWLNGREESLEIRLRSLVKEL